MLNLLIICLSGSMFTENKIDHRTDYRGTPHNKIVVCDTSSPTTEKMLSVRYKENHHPMQSQKCPPGVLACRLICVGQQYRIVQDPIKPKLSTEPQGYHLKWKANSVECYLWKPDWNLSNSHSGEDREFRNRATVLWQGGFWGLFLQQTLDNNLLKIAGNIPDKREWFHNINWTGTNAFKTFKNREVSRTSSGLEEGFLFLTRL